VREMSDLEALEAQIIENGQREDVHPLEEADGFRALHERHGSDVDAIAAKVGKSRAYVYGRMKLCALAEGPRQLFHQGHLTASTALLVARIPDADLQTKAATEITEGKRGASEPMSTRDAAAHIQADYMLQLREAPFDANLVPDAGACMLCPKRTGAQPELFADVTSADVCTDPICYRGKVTALWQLRTAKAKETGQRVVTAKESKEIFEQWDPKRLRWDAPFVKLDDTCQEDPKRRTYQKLLGKKVEVALARDPAGNIRELLAKDAVPKLLKAAGHDFKAEQAAAKVESPHEKEQKKASARRKLMKKVITAARETLVETALTKKVDAQDLVRLFLVDQTHGHIDPDALASLGFKTDKAMRDAVPGLAGVGLAQAFIALLLPTPQYPQPEYSPPLVAACKLFGLDLKEIEKGLEAPATKQAKGAAAHACPGCGCTASKPCPGDRPWKPGSHDLCTTCVAAEATIAAAKAAKKPSPKKPAKAKA
jgi:ParB-like chromosome segregation protein Spo0J